MSVASLGVGAWAWAYERAPELGPLVLLCAMGMLSFQLREPAVSSRFGFSFLSIILLASAVITGIFGSWLVGIVSMAIDRDQRRWSATVFNMGMTGLVGVSGAVVYRLAGGATNLDALVSPADLGLRVGLPLIAADVVGCLVNALLIAGVFHFDQGVPFGALVRLVLAGSGFAYVGYGVIGFLFVILWFPAKLEAFSAVLVIVPLLAARWAFIQYGDEVRSHERTVDTLVTALGTKEPEAVAHSRSAAQLAEWIAEEMGLAPSQVVAVRYAATLHQIGHLGVPTRVVRRPSALLTEVEHRQLDQHCLIGARMIEGIDFLEPARSGIRHQAERFDGSGRPDGLAGADIPVAARVVAVVGRYLELTDQCPDGRTRTPSDSLLLLERESGRFDPAVLEAARTVLARHGWRLPAGSVG